MSIVKGTFHLLPLPYSTGELLPIDTDLKTGISRQCNFSITALVICTRENFSSLIKRAKEVLFDFLFYVLIAIGTVQWPKQFVFG